MSGQKSSASSKGSGRKRCESQRETFLDEEGWIKEAKAVIHELTDYVQFVDKSTQLPPSNSEVFLNLTTRENNSYTVLLNCQGFRVVGWGHDLQDKEGEPVYETPHSMLDNLSPGYRKAFGDHLTSQLLQLQQERLQQSVDEEGNSD